MIQTKINKTVELSKPLYMDKEWLYNQYWNKKNSLKIIAEKCNCHSTTISRYIDKFNILKRNKNQIYEVKRNTLNHFFHNRDWLYNKYINEKKSIEDIAKICFVKKRTIQKWLIKHKIPIINICKNCKKKYSPQTFKQRKFCSESCKNKYWRKNNKNKVINSVLKSKYNINISEFKNMAIKQEFKCKICGKKGTIEKGNKFKRSLVIDHSHRDNKIRGLLCNSCNSGLGNFNDNIQLLKNTIKYLEENK